MTDEVITGRTVTYKIKVFVPNDTWDQYVADDAEAEAFIHDLVLDAVHEGDYDEVEHWPQ